MPRHKENRTSVEARVHANTPAAIRAIALALGYTYAGKPSIGQLLDGIAQGEVLVIKKTSERG